MIPTDQNVPPKREDRLGACVAYGGGACGLKRKFGGCRLRDAERGFGQGSICQLLPALAILNTIPDSVLIVHGSVGCGGAGHAQNAGVRSYQTLKGSANPMGVRWLSTCLNERDVVTGGEGKLESAIVEADRRYRPSAIIVVSSCVPGIIGDDIDGVTARVQPRVAATIVPVHCEGFRTRVMATAYDAIYHGVARRLLDVDDPLERDPIVPDEYEDARERIRRSRLVNLMSPSSTGPSDEAEMRRLLSALDLQVQVFPCFAHPGDMRRATEAAVSVSTCPTHDDYILKHLQERYGVPYLLKHMPIGIKATSAWVRDVAAFFGFERNAEELIAREERELEEALAPFRQTLAGKKVMLSAGEVRTLATAAYLKELGMEVVAVRPYHYDEFGETSLTALAGDDDQDGPIVNVATVHPYEGVSIVNSVRPDIYLGHCADNVWAAKQGVPTLPIYHSSYTYIGYAGAFDIVRRVARVLKNPSFNRNLARNVRQPYHRDWFTQDTFSLIADGGSDAD